MEEKRTEERLALEPPDLISAELELEQGEGRKKAWHLDVHDCSRHGLGLLVTEADFDLLMRVKVGDKIPRIKLYAEWAMLEIDVVVRHITRIPYGANKGNCVIGVQSKEIVEICNPE